MNRRTVLRTFGIGIGATATLPSAVTGRDNLNRTIRDRGYYSVVNAGSRDPLLHAYRSKQPLNMKTNEGGMVRVHPKNQGIHAEIDLTDEDVRGGAGFMTEKRKLGDIDGIVVESKSNPFDVNLLLDTGGNDEIFAWDDVRGNRERRSGMDGDKRTSAGTVGQGEVTIDRDSHEFEDFGDNKRTIEEWDQYLTSDPEAQFVVHVSGDSSREATFTRFEFL